MSLDVYLTERIPIKKKGTGVFIRKNGQTVELKLQIRILLSIWVAHKGKRLGFCGVYAQECFHAIEPNQC